MFNCTSKIDKRKEVVSTSVENIDTIKCDLKFNQDSGYILKSEGLKFLLSSRTTDTANSSWHLFKDNDTIGKYYKVVNAQSCFLCLIDYGGKYSFETHIVFEINNKNLIVKSERFFHGNYSCCWENSYDGFMKYGDYFAIKTCGTGSGFCSSYLYVFKELFAQDSMNGIPESCWSAENGNGMAKNITSALELVNEKIIMHYTAEAGIIKDSKPYFKVKYRRKFDVMFYFENKYWKANDSSELEGLVF